MTMQSPIALGLAAVVLTACALAFAGPSPDGTRPGAVTGNPGPFACALHVFEGAGGVEMEARMTAREAVRGTYALAVTGAGVSIDQTGEAVAAPGETVVLGQASVSGRAADLDPSLVVTAGGTRVACPVRR